MKIPLVATLLVAFLSQPSLADTRFAGYLKTFAVAQDRIDLGAARTDRLYQSQSSMRLMWDVFEGDTVFQLHYEATPVLSSKPPAFDTATFASAGAWRLTDLKADLAHDGRQVVTQNLDRLNVQFRLPAGDLTIGRQPITFGMARVINPTDVFLPFDVRTFNQEYRFGVDAIRFQHPFGQLSEVDTGIILGDGANADTSAAFVQIRTNVNGKDLHLALTRFAGQSLVGGGIQTSFGGFGFWAEVASVTGDEDYVRFSTGFDYALTENLYAMAEYHYNGAGTSDPARYPGLAATAPYRVGGVFLLGKHYLIPAVTWQASPLVSVSLQSLLNLSDHSSFTSLAATWNITENAYVDLGIYNFTGAGIRSSLTLVPGSEYGASPTTLYTSLRYYF